MEWRGLSPASQYQREVWFERIEPDLLPSDARRILHDSSSRVSSLFEHALKRQSSPFFFRMSGAFSFVISIVGSVMTGSSFSPLRSLAACRNPSAPGVA